jgi:asparagine synthase (glutamine-hydrolysing)
MCTICGHFSKDAIYPQDIYDMMNKMQHRGPDFNGIYMDGEIRKAKNLEDLKVHLKSSRIALGHSRLSIIGTGSSTQPYNSCDKGISLIHNGEIYNYQQLKSLLLKNHNFSGESDSEVIVHLIEEMYDGSLEKAVKDVMPLLDGMYTFAVTDGHNVVLARDPIGKKPLYYVENDGIIYFASEKKALWNSEKEPLRLKPGYLLVINDYGYTVKDGYQINKPYIDIVDFDEAKQIYKNALKDAVSKRLIGLKEEKVGVIFSGGIDSVLIAKLLMDEGQSIKCYCAGTEDSGDINNAKKIARKMGLPLNTFLITEDVINNYLEEIIENVEESGLLQVEVAFPMYLAALKASQDGIKVMFSGQAADELFAGYEWYKKVMAKSIVNVNQKLWEDLERLYDDTLEREDKLTMAHSIELRVPYLDRAVINIAMRISPKLKISADNDNMGKYIHRMAAVELGVPYDIAFRPKDPAQSGSGMNKLLEKVILAKIKKKKTKISESLYDTNIRKDKGSKYRYGQDEHTYGSPDVRSYIQRIGNNIRQGYINASNMELTAV